MRPRRIAAILFIIMLLLGGCDQMPQNTPPPPPETLGDIAYDVNESYGYTVYLKENGIYTPYLVLTNDYEGSGNVLLLRKLLLDEYVQFNDYPNDRYAYYNGSIVDVYLNETFLSQIDASLRERIADTEITITEVSSLWSEERTEQIVRKVFLLSYTELDLDAMYTRCVEGESLKYFADVPTSQRLIAHKSEGASSWTLRTPILTSFSLISVIGPDGTIGQGATYLANGVRPAFCLPQGLPIYEDLSNGETVYYFVE